MSFSTNPITLGGWETVRGRYPDFVFHHGFSRCNLRVIPIDELYVDPFYERRVGPCKRYTEAEDEITLSGKIKAVEMCPEERLHLLADVMEELVTNNRQSYRKEPKKLLTEDDGTALKERRLSAGWEVSDVATFLGISEAKVIKAERGKSRSMRYDLWEQWCSIPYGG